jgi:hypothetical protein
MKDFVQYLQDVLIEIIHFHDDIVINISSYPILPNESEVMIVCDNVISY